MSDDLITFLDKADAESDFIRFEDGEPMKGTYVGAKLIDDTFNKGDQTMEYTLTVGDKDKTFNSKSVALARQMKGIKKGDNVEIVKTGQAFDTKWYVKKEDS